MALRIITPAPEAPKKVSVAEDMARSAGTGITNFMAGTFGQAGDLRSMGESLAGWVRDNLDPKAKGRQLTLPPLGAMNPAQEAVRNAAKQIITKAGADPRLARALTVFASPGGVGAAPTTPEAAMALTHDKPLYKPQTKAGEYTRTVATFAPAALVPGTATQRLTRVLAPALTSETAGQLTKGKPVEPYARLAGALLGGGVGDFATRGAPRERLLAEASRPATDAQIAEARALMEAGQARGVRLTMAEALQQVTNSGTGMSRMQRVLEGTNTGNAQIAPVMSARPGEVRGAITGFADQIAPPTDQPSMLGAQAQETADRALNGVRQGINDQARPFYDQLPGDSLPATDYAALSQNPSYTAALRALRSNPELNARYANLPDTDLSVVNAVIKRLNTGAEQVRPGPMNVQGADHELASIRDAAAQTARETASQASPAFEAARQIVAEGRQANLEPLQRGPLGTIAANPDVRAQTGALFPGQPLEGGSNETRLALQMMGGPTSDAAKGLVRQQIVNSANEATQDLVGGPNQWGGAKWAAGQMGNPEQARTLSAGVEAVGGDPQDLNTLAEVLRATGRRERPGSMTAYNQRDIEELGKAGMVGEVMRTGLNPPGTFRRLGQGFQDWQTSRSAEQLASAIIADPAQAEQILMRAREVVPPGAALQAIERAALAAQLSRTPLLENQNGPR